MEHGPQAVTDPVAFAKIKHSPVATLLLNNLCYSLFHSTLANYYYIVAKMTESQEPVITYKGDEIQLELTINNAGWSDPKPFLSFESSRSSPNSVPTPLNIPRVGEMTEDTMTPRAIKIDLSMPTFDLGLGNFGGPSKQVETGRGEISVKELKEFHDSVHQGWEDEESTSEYSDGASSNASQSSTLKNSTYGRRLLEAGDLLEQLDYLEAARPELPERQSMPGGREDIWEEIDLGSPSSSQPQRFDNWIDEVVALEEWATMPEGTRYYKSNTRRDSDSSDE